MPSINNMMILILILAILVGIATIVLLILALIDYFENYRDDIDQYGPKIKFSMFYKAYHAHPERWDVTDEDYVACYMPTNRQCFHFSYIDTWLYRLWNKMEENKIDNIENKEIINNMLEFMKQDKENNQC